VPIPSVMVETVLLALRPDEAGPLTAFLAERGMATESTDDGYRAVELAQHVQPGAVLVGRGLAGPDLPDLVGRLKGVARDCRIIVLLDEVDPVQGADLLRVGADALLSRPGPEFLWWAMARVDEGGLILSPDVARAMAGSLADSVVRERQWARELAQRTLEAEQLAQAKTDFLGNVSHEIRTPLTIIKGLVSLLRRTSQPNDQQASVLSQLEEAADRLTGIVESLVTQAEIRRGDFVLETHECDLAAVIREGAESAGRRYPDIALELVIPSELPAVADARGIREVVRQVVDNACRYSRAAGTVTVKAGRGPEGINVHVTDRGLGVDRGQIAAAFGGPFTPGEEVMTKERAGLGLGLHLARNLVALHGGILWAEPLPAGGSRVSFTLPPHPPEGRIMGSVDRIERQAAPEPETPVPPHSPGPEVSPGSEGSDPPAADEPAPPPVASTSPNSSS
jgi:signal transduction histidine kinase